MGFTMLMPNVFREYLKNRSKYRSQTQEIDAFKSDFFDFLGKNENFISTIGIKSEHIQLVDRLCLANTNGYLTLSKNNRQKDLAFHTYSYKHPMDHHSDSLFLLWNLTNHAPLYGLISSNQRDIRGYMLSLLFLRGENPEETLNSTLENVELKNDGKKILCDDGISYLLLGEFRETKTYCHAHTPNKVNIIPSIPGFSF